MKLMSQSLNLQSQITLNLRLVDYGVGCGTVFVTYFSVVISATADVSDEWILVFLVLCILNCVPRNWIFLWLLPKVFWLFSEHSENSRECTFETSIVFNIHCGIHWGLISCFLSSWMSVTCLDMLVEAVEYSEEPCALEYNYEIMYVSM